MADAQDAALSELLWTIAQARVILPPDVSVQAPPNLSPAQLTRLIDAGINDWGGVSAVTPDYVNPEAPWPSLLALRAAATERKKHLVARLTIYPQYLRSSDWLDRNVRRKASNGQTQMASLGKTAGARASRSGHQSRRFLMQQELILKSLKRLMLA